MSTWADLTLSEQRKTWKRYEVVEARIPKTPCEAAFFNAALRKQLVRWLDAGLDAGWWIMFDRVRVPGTPGTEEAYFHRIVRPTDMAGISWHCAGDPRTRTIFVSRRLRRIGPE